MNSKVLLSISIAGSLVGCGGPAYPEGYSEADKACFDYGAEACKNFQAFCSWQPGDPDTEEWAGHYWWDLEENQSYNSGSFFRDQRDTCESLDSNNEAFYSGAVNAGCDLMTFTDALIDINSWIPSYDPEEEVWTHHVCDY
jgi:hypothetical protein